MAQIALQDYLRKIDALLEENRLAEVVAHCRHILQRYPRHVETYRTMGKALLEQQKHADAADILFRVLSADPEDFIAHAGLAVIRKEAGEIPAAIWHMERAFEMDPYNSAIQRELKELYARRDGLEPDRIALTHGALARLYVRGELFQQAAGELRQVLAADADRIDLRTLLAEALWRDEQRVEAAEICRGILEQLPYSIKANAILAEVWLASGRVEEAQAHLRQLKALTVPDTTNVDPESIVGQAFSAASFADLPKLVRLEELDYIPAIQAAEAEADWVQEVGFAPAGAEVDADTDWLRAMDTAALTLDEEPAADRGPEDVLEWLREVTVADDKAALNQEMDAIPDPFAKQPAGEEVAAADQPPAEFASDDWLSEIDSAAESDFWQAGPEVEVAAEAGQEPETSGAADLAAWLEDAREQPPALSDEELADLAIGEIAPEEAFPDWLSGQSPQDEAAGAVVLPDWLDEPADEAEMEQDALPDWLGEFAEAGGVEAGDAVLPAGAEELPDWLAGTLAAETAISPAGEEDEAPEEQLDWPAGAALAASLVDDQEPAAVADSGGEVEPAGLVEGPAASGDDELPDWLISSRPELEEQVMGTPEEPEKDEQDVPEVPEEDLDETMRWLEELAAAQGANPDELPSFMDRKPEPPEEPVSEDVSFAEEDIPDWLQTELDETLISDEQIPDWLREGGPAAPEPEEQPADALMPAADAGEPVPADDIPDWLRAQMPDDLDLSAPAGGPEQVDDFADSLGWLDQIAAGEGEAIDEPPTLSWDSLEAESEEAAGPQEAAELDAVDFGDMSWLEELSVHEDELIEDMPGPAADVLIGSEVFAEEDFFEEADFAAEVEPVESAEAEPWELPAAEPFELPEMAGEAEVVEAMAEVSLVSATGEPDLDEIPEDPDEAMAWLERLAAQQGAPLEELPSLEALPEAEAYEPDVTEEPAAAEAEWLPAEAFGEAAMTAEIPEDPDEAMAWLEKLAARQGAPAEELPSLSQAGVSPAEPVAEEWEAEEWEAEEWTVEEPVAEEPVVEEPVAEEPVGEEPAPEEPEPLEEAVFEAEAAEELAAVADTIIVGQAFEAEPEADLELERALAELADLELPADDDEAMAWLADLAGIKPAQPQPEIIEEMPTPPTAHRIPGWPEELAEEVAEEAEYEAVPSAVEADIVEDEAEAMAWLEQLAARQGAALDELTSVEQVADEVATPDWVTREAAEAPPEAFFEPETGYVGGLEEAWPAEELEFEEPEAEEMPMEAVAEAAEELTWAEETAEEIAWAEEEVELEAAAAEFEAEAAEELPAAADEPFLEIDQELGKPEMAGSMPDWLSLEPSGEAAAEELDWLDTFGEADFDSWLEAEEESMAGEAPELVAPTAVEGWPAETAVPELAEEYEETKAEWAEVEAGAEREALVLPPISGPIDREKLSEARSALEAGDIDQAIDRYTGLIDEDQGLPMVIADLETAASHLGAEPKLQRLLGDAYMRNGQLQKALEMYRQALDHL